MSDQDTGLIKKPKPDWKSKIAAKLKDPAFREKLGKVLPRDLVKSLPTSPDPGAFAEWAGRAIQRGGLAFYGTLLTVLLCTYFLADLTALLVEKAIPAPPAAPMARSFLTGHHGPSLADYQPIFTRNLFNSSGKIPGEDNSVAPISSGPQDLGGEPVKTSLPFNLIGTMVLKDELRSIATIEDKAASQIYPVRVDDEIPSKAKILKIEPARVIFVNESSGRREYIELPKDLYTSNPRVNIGQSSSGPGIQKTAPNQFSVSRAEVDKAFSNLNNILTQARCVPNFENGLPAGFKCFQIVPGSIYDKLGMQNGDVLCGLNGEPINDISKAMELLGELKTANHLELCIKRDGRQMTNSYDIQ